MVDDSARGDTRGPERYAREDVEAIFDDGVEVGEAGGVVAGNICGGGEGGADFRLEF